MYFGYEESRPCKASLPGLVSFMLQNYAGFVVDLLCGCGCRTYKVKECVNGVRNVCKDVVDTRCR